MRGGAVSKSSLLPPGDQNSVLPLEWHRCCARWEEPCPVCPVLQ